MEAYISKNNNKVFKIKTNIKQMKTIKTVGLLLLSMMLINKAVAQTETKDQIAVPLSDPTKPYSLTVKLINGSIKVASYAGKEILIEAQAANAKKEESKTNAEGMKRIVADNGLELTAEENNNKVVVHSDSWKRAVNLTIKVPQNGNFKLHTINNGDITVENINGEMEVNNVNGAIKLSNISGSVVANTVNGNIITNFKSVDAKAPMAFTTLNGNVDITFPATIKTNVKLKSDRGEILSDFDIDIDKTQPKTNTASEKGMYKIKIEDWIYGKINGGGPEIMMKNMHGNIYLRKSK